MASNILVKRIATVLFISFLFTACTRIGTTEMGLGLLPSMDAFNTKDTILEVETETVDRPDSLRIYGQDDQVVGVINNDPLFGSTNATMYFQLSPSYFPYYLRGSKDSIVVDSAVLMLAYKGAYGDTTTSVVLNLKSISTTTPIDRNALIASNYPEAYNLKTDATMANPYKLDFTKIHDSIINRYEATKNQIRIPLNQTFTDLFTKVFDSTSAYRSDSTLREYFPGFALSASNVGSVNALVRINLLDTNTKLGLYYRTNSTSVPGTRDTIVDYFKFSLYGSGYANFVKRNRSGSEAARHIGVAKDSLVYVQTSPGTVVKIKVPGLKSFANKIIHRAELIAEQVPTETQSSVEAQYTPPNYLFLAAFDSAANVIRNVPNDYQGTVNTTQFIKFGGRLIYKSIQGYNNIASYNFDLSRYMQGVVSRKDTIFDLRMFAPVNDSLKYVPAYPNNLQSGTDYLNTSLGNQPAMGRVRLGGGKHSKFKMRLHVYYSDL